MSFFFNILRSVAPIAIKTGKAILGGLLGGSMTGFNLQAMGGQNADKLLTPEEADMSQVTQGLGNEMTQGELAQSESYKAHLNSVVFFSPWENCDPVKETCWAKFKYSFDPTTPNSGKDVNTGLFVVGNDDHAFIHLCPTLMTNFTTLLDTYDAFYLGDITIRVKDISNNTNPTTLKFFPRTKDTSNITNDSVNNAWTGKEIPKDTLGTYVISCISPQLYDWDSKKTRFTTSPYFVPNQTIICSEIKNYYTGTCSSTDKLSSLSYGTLCFLKGVSGTEKIVTEVEIGMNFLCFNQSKAKDVVIDPTINPTILPRNIPPCMESDFENEEEFATVTPVRSDRTSQRKANCKK